MCHDSPSVMAAAVTQSVREFASHAEGLLFEFRPRQIKVIK